MHVFLDGGNILLMRFAPLFGQSAGTHSRNKLSKLKRSEYEAGGTGHLWDGVMMNEDYSQTWVIRCRPQTYRLRVCKTSCPWDLKSFWIPMFLNSPSVGSSQLWICTLHDALCWLELNLSRYQAAQHPQVLWRRFVNAEGFEIDAPTRLRLQAPKGALNELGRSHLDSFKRLILVTVHVIMVGFEEIGGTARAMIDIVTLQ